MRPSEGVCVDWIPGCHGSVASVHFVTVQGWEVRWRTQERGMVLNQTSFSPPGQKGLCFLFMLLTLGSCNCTQD